MGWTCAYKGRNESTKEFFAKRFNPNLEIVDTSVINFRECYMALRNKEEGSVFAFVIMLEFTGDAHFNFCYKDMDETMNPHLYNCPERILKKLTPTQNDSAQKWRDKCFEVINSKRQKPKPKDGDIVKFKQPISFTNGESLDTFIVKKEGRRVRFLNQFKRLAEYQIAGWTKKDFDIMTN